MTNPNESDRLPVRKRIELRRRKRHAADTEETSSEFEQFEDGDPVVDDDDAWDPDVWEDE
jgi:hypothetical protein